MVSTRQKDLAQKSAVTQPKCLPRNATVLVSSCRECLSLLLSPQGGRHDACMSCEQVEDLFTMVAELKEEVERLRSIRECEQEINWWSISLPYL